MTRKGERFLRSLAARRAAALAAAEPRTEDRRQAERRSESLTGEQLDERLRQLGISADRRRGQRRTGGDRRR